MYSKNSAGAGGGTASRSGGGGATGRKFYFKDIDASLDTTPSIPRRTVLSGLGQTGHPKLLSTPGSSESSKRQSAAATGATGTGREFTPLLRTVAKPENAKIPQGFESYRKPDPLLFDEYQDTVSLESFDKSAMYSSRKKKHAGVESLLQTNRGKENKLLGESSIPLKEQEKVIYEQKNLIFDLQLRINLLEQCTPENVHEVAMQNADLKQEIIKYRTELESLKLRLEQMEREKAAAAAQPANASTSESRILLKNQEISELNDRLEELQEEISKLKDTVDEKDEKIDELEQARSELEQDLDNAKGDESTIALTKELQDKVDDLESEVDNLQHENRQLLRQKESLEDDNEKLREELEADNTHDNKEIEEMKKELYKLRKENRDMQVDFSDLQRANQQLEAQVNDKNAKLDQALAEALSYKEDALRQTTRVQELQDLLQDQMSETGRAEEQAYGDVQLLKSELQSKSSIVKTLEIECEALQTELLNVKSQYSAASGELESVKILMNRTSVDSENYKKERDYFEQKLHETQSKMDRLSRQANESIMDKTHSEDMLELKNELRRKDQELDRKANLWRQDKMYLEEKVQNLERIKSTYEEQERNLLKDKSSSVQEAISLEKSKHEQNKKSLELEISQLKTTISNLNADIDQLRAQEKLHKTLQTELQEKEDDIMASQHQLIMMEDMKNETEEKLSRLRVAHTSLENTVTALREANETERQSRLKYETELREVQAELVKLTREKESMELAKEGVENKLELLEIKHEKLKARFDAVTETCSKLKTKLSDSRYDMSQSMIQQTASASSKYIQKCKDYAREIQRIRINEQTLEAQVERYKNHAIKLKERLNNVNSTRPAKSETHHQQELKGMLVQMQYLKQVATRESQYRSDLEFMKQFFMLQIASYQACNRADLAILQTMGIYPDYDRTAKKRPKLQSVAFVIIAAIRLKKRYEVRDSQLQKSNQLSVIRSEWRRNRRRSTQA
ncbi:pericentrin Pcp1 [Sugiyamaella lignohabitans]|uniref:Pericentrin Pcp1 n=1 Tax=Sugiyamaella lignohabitans TaxID=796027 RepID=A0A167D9Q2_9ASCO|nr:pericentrin Pcp1 [Sugiyamaella lignohabitans]ANB12653.1 pericentrin Pcp1 [Sugiyamaella lignohabitans]